MPKNKESTTDQFGVAVQDQIKKRRDKKDISVKTEKHRSKTDKYRSKTEKHRSKTEKRGSKSGKRKEHRYRPSPGAHQNNESAPEEQYEDGAAQLENKTRGRLKIKIIEWLDYDDKIKMLNAEAKKYKDAKKQHQEIILNMISKLGVEDKQIDVHDDNNELRSRVYRYKSVTKGALKEDIIKNALMEVFRDENKVVHLLKKIDSKRPNNERYYLKRTKGNKNNLKN